MNIQPRHIKLFTRLILISAIGYGFFWLLTGAYFSQPNVEDFSLCATPKNYGIAYGIQDLLLNYDGRYFTNFLHAVNPLSFGCIGCFKWVIAFNILFPIFCLYYFIRSFPSAPKQSNSLLLASLMVLANLAISPSIVHQIYWMVSSFVYHYSWCLFLLWLGTALRFLQATSLKKKWTLFLISSIILVASLGMNEMFLVINSAALLGLLFYSYKKQKESFGAIAALNTNGLIAILFFLSNPGISNRMNVIGTQSMPNNFLQQIMKGISDFGVELLEFWSYAGLIVPLALLFYIWGNKTKQPSLSIHIKLLLSGLFILLLTAMTFYLPMGHEPNIPFRIFTSIFWALLLLFVFILAGFIGNAISKVKANEKTTQLLGLIAATIFAVCTVVGDNNLQQLKSDYASGAMQAFEQTMLTRYDLLSKAKTSNNGCWTKVTLPQLTNPPKSISHTPYIQANRQEAYWNEAYEKYFLIEEVRLEGDTLVLNDFLQISFAP